MSGFDAAWARCEGILDTEYALAVTLTPMAKAGGDVNARSGRDGARAVMTGVPGVVEDLPALVEMNGASSQGIGRTVGRFLARRKTVSILAASLAWTPRAGDRVEIAGDGDLYEVAEPAAPESGGRVVLMLAAVART